MQSFLSDNSAAVHPAVMEAIAAANRADVPYDGDRLSRALDKAFSDIFECPCESLWLSSGTAANAIALAHFARGWQAILCHKEAHIALDECNAPSFYSGGATLIPLPGASAKITADIVSAAVAAIRQDVHQAQAAAVSITNVSEYGCVWQPDEVAAIAEVVKANGLKLHMDGARFANAVASVGCAPADVTWRVGVDALSFGFTKNGAMHAEALIFFGDSGGASVHALKKRGGHMLSKGRFIAAQILAMLEGDLWLANAGAANDGAARLGRACGARLLHAVEANQLFLRLSQAEAAQLRGQGFDFYDWGEGAARLVVSWNQTSADVAPLADAIASLKLDMKLSS